MGVLNLRHLGVRALTDTSDHASECDNLIPNEDAARFMRQTLPPSDDGLPSRDDAERDVDAMLASLGLQSIRRYMDQYHWHEESRQAHAADRAEPGLKLENVAAHSWHVADAVMLLSTNFPEIDAKRALELAILHDKLELFTGDFDPVGPNGDGAKAHSFDPKARDAKTAIELAALDNYIGQLREPIRKWQRDLILETIYTTSCEARLVKGVDKLQALTFVLAKKGGGMTDEHLSFSLRYSSKTIDYFPKLVVHYRTLLRRLLGVIADYRGIPVSAIVAGLPAPVRSIAVAAEA